ncbi:ATP-binding cassette domain-containing protein [Corynebacterium durum]|mgnify:FL=1|uniref:ATP-binding cassette domain-containing protein n=1 Tax=Corynebacterium durum TaxID=61592 RepID=UPI0028E8E2A9|nr:ATP-binding cassette domain-containing protein [Corynebacterium durum]
MFLRDTVIENIAFGLEQRGVERGEMQRRCLDIADKLGLSDLLERSPRELSTGQAKRLTLAMLLVVEPPHLVLDEPYEGLDWESTAQLRALLGTLPHVTVREEVIEPCTNLPDAVEPGETLNLGEIVGERTQPQPWWKFHQKATPQFRVGPIHLAPRKGGVLWLRGANGSGKTTLLRGVEKHYEAAFALHNAADQVIHSTVRQWWPDAPNNPDTHPLDLTRSQLKLTQLGAIFAYDRPLILLDEPDTALNSADRERFHWMLAAELARGKAVILTSHDEKFVDTIAHYANILHVAL